MDVYTTEEQQIEAIKKWWKTNGNSVLIGIALAITAVLGWQTWNQNKEANQEAAAMMYGQLVEAAAGVQQKRLANDADELGAEVSQEFDAGPAVHISLDNLNLSSRVLHSLQEEGIDSVNALLALSRNDLKKVGGVGEKSLREIEETLGSQGFKLKE